MAFENKMVYWQKRAIEKVRQAISGSEKPLKESVEFLVHAEIYTKKVKSAREALTNAFENYVNTIAGVKKGEK